MEEIFKQYSTPIIIVIVVIALLAIFAFLLSTEGATTGGGGPILKNFQELVTNFFREANSKFTPVGP